MASASASASVGVPPGDGSSIAGGGGVVGGGGRLRTLPLKYWGLHPLYHTDVRLLAVHLSRCVRSAGAGAGAGDGAHLLYGVHPICRAEVSGVVTALRRSGERLTLVLDDGTGAAQVSVFTAHWDGRATHHHVPAVGDAVVAAGKLAFAWQVGAASGRVREVQARSLRAVVADDELPAHWLETLALHARVYCRAPADLLRPALPADALARLSPMAPAGLALRRALDSGAGAASAGLLLAPASAQAGVLDGAADDGDAGDAAAGDDADGGDDDEDSMDTAWFTGLMLRIIKELHPHSLQDREDAAPAQSGAPPRQPSLEAPSPPSPPPLAEHFTAVQLLESCSAHASWQRVLGTEAGGQLRWALEDGGSGSGGGGSAPLARIRRALSALERSGEIFRPGAPLPPPAAITSPPADDTVFCTVSACRVLLPALRAIMASEPPDRRASKRARTQRDDIDSGGDAPPPPVSFSPWPLADIMKALAARPATRHVPIRRVRDMLALLLMRGEAGEADRAFFLEDS